MSNWIIYDHQSFVINLMPLVILHIKIFQNQGSCPLSRGDDLEALKIFGILKKSSSQKLFGQKI